MLNEFQNVRFFKPSEFFVSETAKIRGINNSPSDWTSFTNIYYLAYYLDSVRSRLGRPIVISSGYRSKELNSAVGGVLNSAHLKGLAVDIKLDIHNADYEKIYQIVKDDCRYFHFYKERHYIHVDFTREFLINFYNSNLK